MTTPDGSAGSLIQWVSKTNYQYDPKGRITSYQYDPLGRTVEQDDANGVKTNTAYDPAGRLSSIANSGPQGMISSLVYQYDPVGNRTAQVEEDGAQTTYSYDENDRLIEANYPLDKIQKIQKIKEGTSGTVPCVPFLCSLWGNQKFCGFIMYIVIVISQLSVDL